MISISNKEWSERKIDGNLANKLSQDNNFSQILSKLIVSRKFNNEEIYSINNNSFTISHKKIEKELKFKNFDQYKKKMISSKVIIEQNKREEKIKKEINNFCKSKKIFLKEEHNSLISLINKERQITPKI